MTKVATKKVNIIANKPVMLTYVPFRGTLHNKEVKVEDIFKAICQKAIVEEILEDGTVIRLGTHNYNLDNSHRSKKAMALAEAREKAKQEEAAALVKKAAEEAAAKAKAEEEEKQRKALEEQARIEAANKQAEEAAKREALVAERRAAIEKAKLRKQQEKKEEQE